MLTQEFCPSCGHDAILIERTGFCSDCSGESGCCISCGVGLPQTYSHALCRSCRRVQWLIDNADKLDRYIGLGFGSNISIELVRREIHEKINCLSCGDFVRDPRTFFCTRTVRCRQVKNRYKYLHYHKGVKKKLALETALRELERE